MDAREKRPVNLCDLARDKSVSPDVQPEAGPDAEKSRPEPGPKLGQETTTAVSKKKTPQKTLHSFAQLAGLSAQGDPARGEGAWPASNPSSPVATVTFGGSAASTKKSGTSLEELALELQKAISWEDETVAASYQRELENFARKIGVEDEASRLIARARTRGLAFLELQKRFDKLLQKGILNDELHALYQEICKKKKYFLSKADNRLCFSLNKEFEVILRGGNAEKRERFKSAVAERYPFLSVHLEDVERKWEDAVIAPVTFSVDHRLNMQPFSSRWTVCIDETGMDFSGRGTGRMVALAIPEGADLPALEESFHASHAATPQKLSLLKRLLDAPCGILGMGSDEAAQEGWLALLERLVAWILRLVPAREDAVTEVDIVIENRGDYTGDMNTEIMRRSLIARNDPGMRLGSLVRLGEIRFMEKNESWLGWADLLAWSWNSRDTLFVRSLKPLNESCLFLDVDLLAMVEEALAGGREVNPEHWLALVARRDAEKRGSLSQLALDAMQENCRRHPANWSACLRLAHSYLTGKGPELDVLERMARWLDAIDPEAMTPEMRYLLAMSQLANFNHHGVTGGEKLEAVKRELETSSRHMQTVRPEACCHAALRLAVNDANAFDFATAVRRLAPWDPRQGGVTLGSGLWDGKVFSSLGQYAAFRNDHEVAKVYFRQALDCFYPLAQTNLEEGEKQISQTCSYFAISDMDAGRPRETLEYCVKLAVGNFDLVQAIWQLNGTDDRYQHHLLLRFLVLYGTREEQEAYLARMRDWPKMTGSGHPWPLIQYWRWRLCPDETMRRKLVASLPECRGNDSGPTVDIIYLALQVVMGALDRHSDEARTRIAALRAALPHAAASLDLLEHGDISNPDTLQGILPFNYR